MVIWMIGLSGAGKTTLARAVVAAIRAETPNVVLLDGDDVRAVFGDTGHDMEGRKRNSERMVRMSEWLDAQGIHVVCAILSLFEEDRAALRAAVGAYYEVYIDAPMADLQRRDVKGLYARHARGETRMVAGLDLDFPVPPNPDLIIRNAAGEAALLAHAGPLARRVLEA